MIYDLYLNQPLWIIILLFALMIWSLVWKGVGLWYSGKNEQKGWFITIFIFNSLGILPLLYVLFFKKEKKIAPAIEITTTTESSRPKTNKKKRN